MRKRRVVYQLGSDCHSLTRLAVSGGDKQSSHPSALASSRPGKSNGGKGSSETLKRDDMKAVIPRYYSKHLCV
ncbi:hypothetical protein CesoFtcFv8_019142 [Champsocephalus esox]|uniref:Uncharacterized protein n=1 Tax=Champsocephalus esox TaxID=159716 RepID=A0AAN8BJ68_9TELE|nr:hypothetical protein CesoFtcFv8_019142 [Champsocephalus esox]